MSVRDAAIQVLQEAGKPLHAKEITEIILSKGLWVTAGKTPAATVSTRLYADMPGSILPGSTNCKKTKGIISNSFLRGAMNFSLRPFGIRPIKISNQNLKRG
ncbi:MAG: winged helix-turn-helix domain-containing protein [Thermodesulfobacteriota bacterium]|jgi:hypothetical protein